LKRVKVALDVNVPERAVRMLNSGFGDTGYEFHWEPDLAPASSADEFWAVAFQRFGGNVVITGDKNIARRPHQMLAFRECQLTCFFIGSTWSNLDLAFKVAHLMRWWPEIRTQLEREGHGKCWWVPGGLRGEFKEVNLSAYLKRQTRKKAV
jgi:hypothetical protein